MNELCQNYTSTAHSPQHTVKTLTQVEAKGNMMIMREGGKMAIFLFQNSNPCIIIGRFATFVLFKAQDFNWPKIYFMKFQKRTFLDFFFKFCCLLLFL